MGKKQKKLKNLIKDVKGHIKHYENLRDFSCNVTEFNEYQIVVESLKRFKHDIEIGKFSL